MGTVQNDPGVDALFSDFGLEKSRCNDNMDSNLLLLSFYKYPDATLEYAAISVDFDRNFSGDLFQLDNNYTSNVY